VVVEHEGDAAVGVAGGAAHLHEALAEGHPVTMLQGTGDIGGAGGGGEADGAAGGLVHQPAAGDVVGVGVGVDRGHQADSEFPDQGEVALVLLEHRIDQQAQAGGHVSQEIGEGAGAGVEELAEEQVAAPGGGGEHGGLELGGGQG